MRSWCRLSFLMWGSLCGISSTAGELNVTSNDLLVNCSSPCVSRGDSFVCLPKFLIVASAKSGSSALHYYLEQHPAVRHTGKEVHMSPDEAIARRFTFPQPVCTQLMGVMWNPPKWVINLAKPLAFVLLRRPDDWIYAAYHFWCNEMLDCACRPGEWVDETKHYRSPAHFHWVLTKLCNNDPCSNACPLQCKRVMNDLSNAISLFGREHVHVIFTEELHSSTQAIMRDAFLALGLDPTEVDASVFDVAVNVGSFKGAYKTVNKSLALGRSYEDMLPQSRRAIRESLHFDALRENLASFLNRSVPW